MVLELKLNVTESVAREAKAGGLLEEKAIENMLRAELERQRIAKLFATTDKLAKQPGATPTEQEIETEIAAARHERRAKDARRR